ncbi:MAG: hypothetical protein IJP88_08030 [Synergistaceae bacterium]|nr:hypothetical protein [Synergistaceae bacterium]
MSEPKVPDMSMYLKDTFFQNFLKSGKNLRGRALSLRTCRKLFLIY